MTTVPDLKLNIQRAAASLQRANGGAFDAFIKALEESAAESQKIHLWAGGKDRKTLQGRAQEAATLCDTLRKANVVVTALETKGILK